MIELVDSLCRSLWIRSGYHPSRAGLFVTGEQFFKGMRQKTFSPLLVVEVISKASEAAVSEKDTSHSEQPAGWTPDCCWPAHEGSP
jgi:hypothetical protein